MKQGANPGLKDTAIQWPTAGADRVNTRTDTCLSGDGRETPNKLGWAVANWPDQWGTPSASDWKRGGQDYYPYQKERPEGRPAILNYDATTFPPSPWATPNARDHKGQDLPSRQGVPSLPTVAAEIPPQPWATPSDYNATNGCTPEAWEARKAKHQERKINGNGIGRALAVESQTFPSSPQPETTTGDGSGYSALILLLCRLFGVQTEAEFRAVPKSLNPNFVDFLMGWPIGWSSALTACGSEATGSFHSRLLSLLSSFTGDCLETEVDAA